MIKIGNYEISDAFLGNNTISSIYLGEYEVYSSGDWRYRQIVNDGQVIGYQLAKYKGHDTTVTTPSSYKNLPVLSIGTGCFYDSRTNTPSTVEDLTIASSIEFISGYAFGPDSSYGNYTNNVLETITFEQNSQLVSLSPYAIYKCSAITSLTFPDSLESIGEYGCSGNAALASVTLGTGIESFGASAFANNALLASVTMPANSATAFGNEMFKGCSVLNNIVIPSGITTLGDACFQGCNALDTITIPSTVTAIPASCFSGCHFSNLNFLPNTITSLGASAFSSNPLTDVIVPNSVTTIGATCFANITTFTAQTTVQFPSIAGKFDDWFYNSNIRTITLPAGITDVEINKCNSLSTLNLNNGTLTYISGIHNCNSLRSIVVPDTVTAVAESCFIKLWYLTSLTLSNNMTEVPYRMFFHEVGWGEGPARGNNLTTLNLGTGITSIGSWAFSGCPDIDPLIIPDQVTTIRGNAFDTSYYGNGAELTPDNVVIGSGLTLAEAYAFRNLTGVGKIFYRGTPTQWCSINWGGRDSGQVLFNNNWSNADIYILDPNGTESYGGSTYSKWDTPVIPEGVTTLGYASFLRHVKMKSISLPASLESITFGSYYPAFKECKGLELIVLQTTTSKDYLNELYNFDFGTLEPVNFKIHTALLPIVENLGWDHNRYSVIEDVELVSINSDNWPSSFEGETYNFDPQYEPYYANVLFVNGTKLHFSKIYWSETNNGWQSILGVSDGTSESWVSTVSDPNIATVGIGTDVHIDSSVTSYQPLTVTTYDFPGHVYECSKTIQVKYMNQDVSYTLGNWSAAGSQTVEGNQVYKSRTLSSKNYTDDLVITFEGYTHFEIAARCYANSYSKLYIYNVDSGTSSTKRTLSHTDSYYQKIVFDGLTTGQHTITIRFSKGNTTSTWADGCGKIAVLENNCY